MSLLTAAIPVFVGLVAVELAVAAVRRQTVHATGDTFTSLVLGVGSLVVDASWKAALILPVLHVADRVAPWHIPNTVPWLIVLFLLTDLGMYVTHRMSHSIRFLWGAHSVHHSSEYFNLSTALRQSWKLFPSNVFLAPLVLVGFDPKAMLVCVALTFLYQFWIHTEVIQRCPGWFEFVFNTPSHHRVHHGVELDYLDRNYGAVLIVWDRMLGTFVPEDQRPTYGLTHNVGTYNPLRVAFHEYAALVSDFAAGTTARDRLSAVFGSPRRQRRSEQLAGQLEGLAVGPGEGDRLPVEHQQEAVAGPG